MEPRVDNDFRRCQRIINWKEPEIRASRAKTIEDMPDTVSRTPLASDALRRFLESEVPGAAQFLPVTITAPGLEAAGRQYWIVNCLRVAACLDKARSLNEYEPESGGGVF